MLNDSAAIVLLNITALALVGLSVRNFFGLRTQVRLAQEQSDVVSHWLTALLTGNLDDARLRRHRRMTIAMFVVAAVLIGLSRWLVDAPH